MNKTNPKAIAILLGGKPQTLVPSLLEASRDIKAAQTALSEPQKNLIFDRAHRKIMQVFRQINIKKNELEVYEQAVKDMVVENVVVKKNKNGSDVVQRKIIKSRNINHLARNIGREEVAEIIRLLLVNLNNYFNVRDGLNKYQIEEIAEQIIDECGDKLFIDELVYIFKKMKVDTKLYNHLDGSIIFGRIDKHYNQKNIEKEKKHIEHKGENFDLPALPNSLLKGAVEKMNERYRKNITSMTEPLKIEKSKNKKRAKKRNK